MTQVRYGARSLDEMANREVEATSVDTWATTLVATYESDPDAIAAVLPPPLRPPAEPLVRVTVATVDVGRGYGVFGAGTFAVHCSYEDTPGDYALVMPMTTEQAVIGGRETFGEPKKLAEIVLDRGRRPSPGRLHPHGDHLPRGGRRGRGRVRAGARAHEVELLPQVPAFAYRARASTATPYSSTCIATSAPGASGRWAARSSCASRGSTRWPTSRCARSATSSWPSARACRPARWWPPCPADWIAPYAHQRYDDLSPTGADA